MLVELTVRNLAVIEETRLVFAPGLNVITGETGAGKSLLVDALQFVLGASADRSLMRADAPSAGVEAVFDVSREPDAQQALRDLGVDLDDDGAVILAREIHREGRTVSRLNGRAAPANLVRAVGGALVDIHGQGDQASLLSPAHQRRFLDDYAELGEQRRGVAAAVAAVERARSALRSVADAALDAEQRRDFLAFQVNEIDSAGLREGEEEALVREQALLAGAEAIRDACAAAYASLRDASPNAGDLIGAAVQALARSPDPTGALRPLIDALEAAAAQVDDAAREMRAIADTLDANPERLADIEERLALIRRLKRKYGGAESAALEFAADARRQLEAIDDAGEAHARAERDLDAALQSAGDLAWRLSEARSAAAQILAAAVGAELAEVGLAGAAFDVEVARQADPGGLPAPDGTRYAYSPEGVDQVVFLLRANPGEALLPLAKVASGGETSRMMLALNAALHAASGVPTLVFDEIDAGVGGRTGAVVASKLWAVGRRGQALCVTHLPQIAAYADRHFSVGKTVRGDRVYAAAVEVEDDQRIAELAGMLGNLDSPSIDQAARDMLAAAVCAKESAL